MGKLLVRTLKNGQQTILTRSMKHHYTSEKKLVGSVAKHYTLLSLMLQ